MAIKLSKTIATEESAMISAMIITKTYEILTPE